MTYQPSKLQVWTTLCRTPQPGFYDWACGECDVGLDTNGQIESHIILSLFTWKEETDADPAPSGVENGWWADRSVGSRLYRLSSLPRGNETLALARRYTEEALQWMIDDGLTEELKVTTLYVSFRIMEITVELDEQIFRSALGLNGCLTVKSASCISKKCY